jgi:hypothetical protein
MINIFLAKKTICRLFVQLILGVAFGGVLTGCAFSRTHVSVNFSPNITQPLNAPQKASLEVGEVKDTRLVDDNFVLMHKANAYGPTSGAYVTDVPVADIFRKGLKVALEQNNFTKTGAIHYELRANIQNFGVGVIQNAFASSTVKPWIEVRFELIEKATGQAVWHDTYTGQTTDRLSFGMADAEFIGKVFSEVSQEVIKQLISDKAFRNYFE